MKKIISIILIISSMNLFSAEIIPEPYKKDEFPKYLLDIRRATVIFCGAIPLGYMYSSIVGDVIIDESGILADIEDEEINNKKIELKILSSLIFAGVVMIIDLIIEKLFKR